MAVQKGANSTTLSSEELFKIASIVEELISRFKIN